MRLSKQEKGESERKSGESRGLVWNVRNINNRESKQAQKNEYTITQQQCLDRKPDSPVRIYFSSSCFLISRVALHCIAYMYIIMPPPF